MPLISGLSLAELEERLGRDGRELLRRLLDDHLALRALREQRLDEVIADEGVRRGRVEAGRARATRGHTRPVTHGGDTTTADWDGWSLSGEGADHRNDQGPSIHGMAGRSVQLIAADGVRDGQEGQVMYPPMHWPSTLPDARLPPPSPLAPS